MVSKQPMGSKIFSAQEGISLYVHITLDKTVNYPKKTCFFKEQNMGYIAPIHRVSLKKKKKSLKAC